MVGDASKRTVHEDLSTEPATKKQKLDQDNNNSLVALANAAMMPNLSTSTSPVAAATPPSALLGAYGGLAYPNPSLSQRDLLSQSFIAGSQPLTLSSYPPSMMAPTAAAHLGIRSDLRADGLAQDLLTIRSEQILAARMAMRREMLLDAAMMRNVAAFPNTLGHSFLG